MAWHIRSIHASHPATPGSNLGSAKFFLAKKFSLLLSLRIVLRSNPSSATGRARDFATAVFGDVLITKHNKK